MTGLVIWKKRRAYIVKTMHRKHKMTYFLEWLAKYDIQSIMSKYGRYDLAKTEYQRFKADSNRINKANSTLEYLHILEKN